MVILRQGLFVQQLLSVYQCDRGAFSALAKPISVQKLFFGYVEAPI